MTMLFATALVAALPIPAGRAEEPKPDKVIEVVVRDGKPILVEKGKDKPGTVTAVVGQTVRWVNRDSRPHHFVSAARVDDKPAIDVGVIDPGKHRDLVLDNALYRRLGGKTAGVIKITFHSHGGQADPTGELQILSPARR